VAVLTADRLIAACSDESEEAGITIRSKLDPLAGEGAPIKPATYAGPQGEKKPRFQAGKRWWGDGPDRSVVDILVVDNEPSQANRLEAALEHRRAELGLPEIVLDLTVAGNLPAHLPRRISSFRFPHRNADAYLADATLDGAKFPATDEGKAIFAATADRPEALLKWCPQALLFGFWQSHLGKKGSQAKLARAWTSEILGVEPAAHDIRRLGLKGDPLNLSVPEGVVVDETAQRGWAVAAKGAKTAKGEKKKLSDIGHGQVPVSGDEAGLDGVSFREVVQQATVSFASLRRIYALHGSAEARALLVSLGLVAHVAAFGRPFSLRSEADFRPKAITWTWLGADADEVIDAPDPEVAVGLFSACVERAEAAGLPVGAAWAADPLVVYPGPELLKAIRASWPVD